MKYNIYAKPLLRIGLSLVFLYFGIMQISSPDDWASFVPDFMTLVPNITANNLVIMNAIMELTLGLFLILGLYTRFSSLILSLHLFGIAFSIGFNPLGVRDIGLAIATLSIFLNGADNYCLDHLFNKKRINREVYKN